MLLLLGETRCVCVTLMLLTLALPQLVAGGQHLCGRELADTLALVCHGRGFRTADDRVRRRRSSWTDDELMLLQSANKRSVVDECCIQACSYSQLESYCAPGPSKQANLGDLLKAMKAQRESGAARSVLSMTTTTPTPPALYGDEGPRADSSLGTEGRTTGGRQRPESPYFRNRSFFFVTPSRAVGATIVQAKKRKV